MSRIRNAITAISFVVAMTAAAGSLASSGEAYQQAMVAWARVLATHVDPQGRIDFHGVAANPSDLKTVVDVIADYGPESHPQDFDSRDKVITYHINSYNALAMQGVLDRGIPEGFTSFFKRASFFKFRSVRIAGRKTNLYDYENKVIRPLDEPRIHFALNCMVKDCPRLPAVPFTVDELDTQLEDATREFFGKERHLRIDDAGMKIEVSAILDFYTKDFVDSGRASDLPQYINRYLEQALPADYKVRFIPYDWRINQQPSDQT